MNLSCNCVAILFENLMTVGSIQYSINNQELGNPNVLLTSNHAYHFRTVQVLNFEPITQKYFLNRYLTFSTRNQHEVLAPRFIMRIFHQLFPAIII